MQAFLVRMMFVLLSIPAVTTAARTKLVRQHVASQGTASSECCCKQDKCREGKEGAVYHPDEHLCCKKRSTCKSSFTDKHNYVVKPASDSFCAAKAPADALPEWVESKPEPVDVETILAQKGNSHAKTLHTHCKGEEPEDAEEDAANRVAQHAISNFAKELTDNSVLASSRELFTMYACIRWAPDSKFWKLAQDELDAGQLPQNSRVAGDDPLFLTARASERGQFIPLRCSENIGVYDHKNMSDEHFPVFERRINAMASFFKDEFGKFFDSRARTVEKAKPFEFFWEKNESKQKRWTSLLEDTHVFNQQAVKKAMKECDTNDMSLNVREATGEKLLRDCSFLKWWAPKLKMYADRFPFEGYLAGQKESKIKPGHRVLLCFGKRVAGELHRRNGGSHILTDMNGVGCHGFWDFPKAAEMLTSIVKIWAPPTCQLTELELKMRARMLSMFAEMNKKLFEALPALIASEQFSDAHPSAVEAGGFTSLLAGGKWVANKMSAMFDTYKSLGEIMTNSVMKWSVCPIGKTEGLDKVLGSDDLLAQKYTEEAYSQWTKKDVALPGETCTPFSGAAEKCSIGKVREDYPERYKDVKYACPALPLMPAAQQLKILADKHATKCLVQASPEQLGAESWIYNGLRPQMVQYQPKNHFHTTQMEMVQILDQRHSLDEYGISRSYVTVGRVCTLEVQEKYPLWCQKSALLNVPDAGSMVVSAAKKMADAVAGAAAKVSLLGGNNNKAGWKSWAKRQALSVGSSVSNLAHSLSPSAISNFASSLGGAKKERYTRIARSHLHDSVEAGQALWGMTFQQGEEGGGERNQFDRYVVTVPCDGLDIREEMASEFSWGQVALEILEKASGRIQNLLDPATFTLGVRTEVELHSGTHMPLKHHVAWQANAGEWTTSSDNFAHVASQFELSSATSYSSDVPSVYGAKLAFSCGRREDIYNKRDSGKSFKACLADGMKQATDRAASLGKEADTIERMYQEIEKLKQDVTVAQEKAAKDDSDGVDVDKLVMMLQQKEAALGELLREKPLTLKEFDDEIVVRVVFQNLHPKCQFYKGELDKVSEAGLGQEATVEAKKNKEAADAMKRASDSSGCTASSAVTKYKGQSRSGVVGALMGNKAPTNAREEVILSPLDLKAWVPK